MTRHTRIPRRIEQHPDRSLAPEYLSPADVAHLLHTTVAALAQLRYQQRGPRYYKPDGKIYYLRADIDSYVLGSPVDTKDTPERRGYFG